MKMKSMGGALMRKLLKGTILLAWLPWWFAPEQPLQAQNIRVTGWSELLGNSGRLAWSSVNNKFAYDAVGANGYYNLYTMNANGTSQTCLTCAGDPGASVLPGLNCGNPIWSPDGNFIVFQCQALPSLGSPQLDVADFPGSGYNNDLWATNTTGTFWKLTNQAGGTACNGVPCGGVIYPSFSGNGATLAWGQRKSPTLTFGTWELAVATWSESGGVPSISGTTYYTPGANAGYYEPRSFSLDNSTLFFMGNVSGQERLGMDIYSFVISSQTLTDLTNTPNQWNEFPEPMPTQNKLVYMSTNNTNWSGANNPAGTYSHFECDLWTMNYDGSDKQRLTFYNDPNSSDYVSYGICLCDPRWTASQLAVFNNQGAVFDAGRALNGRTPGQMWILDIEPATTTVNAASYVLPPLAPDAIVTTFGTNLANQMLAAPSAALPTSLGNTTVSVIDGKGVARSASLYFVSPGQINLVIPEGTGPGPAVVTVTNADGVQSRGTVEIGSVSPGFYTMNQNGQGVVAGYVEVVPASGPPTYEPVYSCPGGGAPCTTIPIDVSNSSDQFYLVMFGTGFRGRSALQQVSVTIGNQSVPVLYAGAQGQYEGFDQMDVQLPNSLAGAGVVNIVATVDGAQANVVQIQIQ
jgi:uncharacterized protein (TIGR03437 family)